MAQEIWVQSQVESYQRLKKWYLMPPCLTLRIIRYGSRVKWSNPGKGVAPTPTPRCSKLSKREPSGHPRLWSPTLLISVYFVTYQRNLGYLKQFILNQNLTCRIKVLLFKLLLGIKWVHNIQKVISECKSRTRFQTRLLRCHSLVRKPLYSLKQFQ